MAMVAASQPGKHADTKEPVQITRLARASTLFLNVQLLGGTGTVFLNTRVGAVDLMRLK